MCLYVCERETLFPVHGWTSLHGNWIHSVWIEIADGPLLIMTDLHIQFDTARISYSKFHFSLIDLRTLQNSISKRIPIWLLISKLCFYEFHCYVRHWFAMYQLKTPWNQMAFLRENKWFDKSVLELSFNIFKYDIL